MSTTWFFQPCPSQTRPDQTRPGSWKWPLVLETALQFFFILVLVAHWHHFLWFFFAFILSFLSECLGCVFTLEESWITNSLRSLETMLRPHWECDASQGHFSVYCSSTMIRSNNHNYNGARTTQFRAQWSGNRTFYGAGPAWCHKVKGHVSLV